MYIDLMKFFIVTYQMTGEPVGNTTKVPIAAHSVGMALQVGSANGYDYKPLDYKFCSVKDEEDFLVGTNDWIPNNQFDEYTD